VQSTPYVRKGDADLSMAVMEKVMRRRFQEHVALLSAASVAGGGALWALRPALQPALMAVSQGLAPALGALALAAWAAMILAGG
jgi:hypothetical protein